MKILDIFSTATEGLRERKFRFALNLIGILIGCAAVTGLISITQGLGDEVGGQLEIFGPTNIMVIPGRIQSQGIILQTFRWRDLEVIDTVPHIDVATPIIGDKYCYYEVRGERYFAIVYGVMPEYFDIFKSYKVEQGRALARSDRAAAVIGSLVAKPRGEDEPIIELGERIRIEVKVGEETREMIFRVVGILEEIGGTFGSEDDSSITIPFRVCQQLYEVGGEFEYIAASVDEMENVDFAKEEIKDKMGDSVTVMSYETIQDLVAQVLGMIEAVLGGIAAISLVVAGVGIINTMTISVMERTREIGVLKAIGAKSNEVLLLFLSEALVTGFFGGILGSIVGFLLSNIIGNYINMPVSTSFDLALGVTCFAVLTSALSGLYPAWRAANLNPVDALRYE